MARRIKNPEYFADIRAVEDAEAAAVRAAIEASEKARALRDEKIEALSVAVVEAEKAEGEARRHMVEAIGIEQSARLLQTTPAKLKKSLSAKPTVPPPVAPIVPASEGSLA